MPLLLTTAIRTVSADFSVFASVGLELADGEVEGEADAVAMIEVEAEGEAEGLVLALLLGETDGDGEAEEDVEVVGAGVQETAATEILTAIAKSYNKEFFINVIKS